MSALLLYLIKVILISGILYGYYLVALRDKKFHRYNRFYLISVVLLSLVLPFVRFDLLFSSADTSLPVFIQRDMVMETIVINMDTRFWNTENILWAIYLTIAGLLVLFFIASLIKIYYLKRKGNIIKYEYYSIIESNSKGTPFSFFKLIFWNPKANFKSGDGRQMLKHELIHVRQLHSLDKLLINIIQIVFWFNPFFWIIKREISIVHEFLADRESIENADAHSFSKMALQAAFPGFTWPATNSFFYSPLKRRLAMLLKDNKKKVSYFGRVMALPLAALIFIFFSVKANDVFSKAPKTAQESEALLHQAISDTIPLKLNIGSEEDSKKPLIVVDGREVNNDFLNTIKPQDITSITVLEGKQIPVGEYKSSLALNGVIEIVTNRNGTSSPATGSSEMKDESRIFDSNLIIVDGEVKDHDYLNSLDKKEIVEISVISGSTELSRKYNDLRALNGVMFITTKSSEKEIPSPKPTLPENASGIMDTIPGNDSRIFTKVEQEAQFPGGAAGWHKYLSVMLIENMGKLTDEDYGTCIVKFIVKTDGSIHDVNATTMRGTHLALLAVDAIQNGPKWIPAQQNGHYVNAYRLQPVTLKKPDQKIVLPPDSTNGRIVFASDTMRAKMVFTKVEKLPKFPRGERGWSGYLYNELKKGLGKKQSIEAVCKISFVVDQNGKVKDVNTFILEGDLSPQLLTDIIKRSPDWEPAVQNGNKVSYMITETFTLNNSKDLMLFIHPKVTKVDSNDIKLISGK